MNEDAGNLHDKIEAIVNAPLPEATEEGPTDEIVDAIVRQLDVLQGTAAVLSNISTMLLTQVDNLRAEVALFAAPPAEVIPIPEPKKVKQAPSGAVVLSTLPEDKRPEGVTYCGHADALIVDTVDGFVKVCPECDD